MRQDTGVIDTEQQIFLSASVDSQYDCSLLYLSLKAMVSLTRYNKNICVCRSNVCCGCAGKKINLNSSTMLYHSMNNDDGLYNNVLFMMFSLLLN